MLLKKNDKAWLQPHLISFIRILKKIYLLLDVNFNKSTI